MSVALTNSHIPGLALFRSVFERQPTSSQTGSQRRSYAGAVRRESVAWESYAPLVAPTNSLAELHAACIPLPGTRGGGDNSFVPPDFDGRSYLPVPASAYSMVDLNAGTTLVVKPRGQQPLPIGFERQLAKSAIQEDASPHGAFAYYGKSAYLPTAVSNVKVTDARGGRSPAACAQWPDAYLANFPSPKATPLSPRAIAEAFPPYIPRPSWQDAAYPRPISFTGHSEGTVGSCNPTPSSNLTSPCASPLHSQYPPPSPPKPRRRRYHGPFDACSREDVLAARSNADFEDEPMDLETRLAQLHALAQWNPEQVRKHPSSHSAEQSPLHSPPPVVQERRRLRYHGPFDACSREDVLGEASDTDFEDEPMEPEARLAALRALASHDWRHEEQEKLTGDDGHGWSVREMERYTRGVKNRLLAAYRMNPPIPGPPTALRGLPIVVQARAVYPAKVWSEVILNLEEKSAG